jgi:hypothetical protein
MRRHLGHPCIAVCFPQSDRPSGYGREVSSSCNTELLSIVDNSYPWPQKGDDPFALNSAWRDNACLNFFGGDVPWTWFAEGYKLAGDLSVAHVEATGRYQDKLVYPTLFNYRQYIELSLKGIIRDARRLLDDKGGAPGGHGLMRLWNTARPLLFRIAPAVDDLDNVGRCIERFDAIDRTSQGFRYPVTTAGDPILPEDLNSINLSQARDVVERLDGFFGAAEMQIDVMLDYKSDALAAEYDTQMEIKSAFADAYGDPSG